MCMTPIPGRIGHPCVPAYARDPLRIVCLGHESDIVEIGGSPGVLEAVTAHLDAAPVSFSEAVLWGWWDPRADAEGCHG